MVEVRSIRPGDAADWLRMRLLLWPEDTAEGHAREITAYFGGALRAPLEVLIAVESDGSAVGFAELSIRSYAEDCETDHVGYLEGWYVDSSRRRQGIGRALVAAAERWARGRGCTEFASDALLDNQVSADAHRALGFDEAAQIRCFRKSLERGS
jgi:aminoglycoside 6'-N-acetyltransferase I